MTVYALVLFLHLTSVVTLFVAFGIEWAAISFLALLLAILSGGYLASLISAFKQGWVPASFIGIAVVALLGAAINVPKMRAIRLAIPQGSDALSAALQTKLLPVSVRLRTFVALGIVFIMGAKLPLGPSVLALLGGLVVGLILSLPVLVRKSA